MQPATPADTRPALMELLAQVPDRRGARGKRYPLPSILGVACLAVMCGADTYAAIADFARDRHDTIGPLFGFDRCMPPCAATYFNTFRSADAEGLEWAIRTWIASFNPDSEPLAIDGKTLRGSRRKGLPGLHLLMACSANGDVLAQLPVDGKTNETKTALELLRVLPVAGRVVTGDAMFTQREVCEHIVGQGGDYLLPVKQNQPQLLRDIELAFEPAVSPLGEAATAA